MICKLHADHAPVTHTPISCYQEPVNSEYNTCILLEGFGHAYTIIVPLQCRWVRLYAKTGVCVSLYL